MKKVTLNGMDCWGPEGIFLVRVDSAQYRWRGRHPQLSLRFSILAPVARRNQPIIAELDCSDRHQWMLRWFLRDFGWCSSIENDQLHVRDLAGLTGVVRTSLARLNRRICLALDGFAPASTWPEFTEVAL